MHKKHTLTRLFAPKNISTATNSMANWLVDEPWFYFIVIGMPAYGPQKKCSNKYRIYTARKAAGQAYLNQNNLNLNIIHLLSTHTVPQDTAPTYFSEYSIGLFKALPSHNSVKKAIKRGALRINGERAETGSWVGPGMEIELYESEQTPPKAYHTTLEIAVIYEDEYLALVNKPAGLATSGNQFRTLENALIGKLSASGRNDALAWPKPVHRLDAATSGLVIMAKTKPVRIALGEMFEKKKIRKTYQALVIGSMPDSGAFNTPVQGLQAFTEYQLIQTVPSLKNNSLSLVELSPHSGRTHQLRIHLSEAGFPILGDPLYGKPGAILKGKGLFLCARALSFEHPVIKTPLDISIPLPHKFSSRMRNEQARWERFRKEE